MNHQEVFLKFTVGNPDDQEIFLNVRGVLLQPFQMLFKYTNLKGVLIECRWLTTPKRVTKVISDEKPGSDIPSRFLRRLQKTAGLRTSTDAGFHQGSFGNPAR